MFKVTQFMVRAFALDEGEAVPVGETRTTRDEAEVQRWAQEMVERFDRKGVGDRREVMTYMVIGEPMFDLWEEPRVTGRYPR